MINNHHPSADRKQGQLKWESNSQYRDYDASELLQEDICDHYDRMSRLTMESREDRKPATSMKKLIRRKNDSIFTIPKTVRKIQKVVNWCKI